MRSTQAIINTRNFLYNLKSIRKRTGKNVKICMALKADAYGHGAPELSRIALESGSAEYIGVAAISEGAELREYKNKGEIILLSLALGSEVPDLFDYNITPFAADLSYLKDIAKEASKRNKVKTVHLKVDTGMNRIGCRINEAGELAQFITKNKNLKLGGICTHLPVSDSPDLDHIKFTQKQIKDFSEVIEKIRNSGINPGIIHAANSGGILYHNNSYFDMVRPGIILYGSYPNSVAEKNLNLKAVMSFESKIVFIKKINKGERVSYGLIWEAPRDTYIATVPAGYADGYNRHLSNIGSVQIKEKLYPVAGRVCMDQLLVDLGKNPAAKVGDKVILIGGNREVSCESLADKCGTVSYEIYCNIHKRVPRIYK